MNLIYTKKGDKGKSFINGKYILKSSLIFKILGQTDEFICYIGFLKNLVKNKNLKNVLEEIQEEMFILQAKLASIFLLKKNPKNLPDLKDALKNWEEFIDNLNLKVPQKFIVPATNKESAICHLLRAKIRIIEENLVDLIKNKKEKEEFLSYINRLSSLFYALSLKLSNKKEKFPNYKIKKVKWN
jgi:cob(I)alamin adenosyltransferase